MSKADTFENELLKLVFQNIAIPNVGDAGGLPISVTVGSLYVSLHTADPGEAGLQNTSEATYTGYARVGVVRSSAGWTVTTNAATNAATVTFGLCTVGTNVLTYFGVGKSVSGATELLYSGQLAASLTVNPGITPSFAVGQISVTED